MSGLFRAARSSYVAKDGFSILESSHIHKLDMGDVLLPFKMSAIVSG